MILNASFLKYKTNFTHHIHGLDGASKALFANEIQQKTQQTLLYIAPSIKEAHHAWVNLNFFSAEKTRIQLFPDWEVLPYETLSPSPNIIGERLQTLHQLHQNNIDILVVALPTLLHSICPPSFLDQEIWKINVGEKNSPNNIRKQLENSGYYKVNTALSAGEFSVRGEVMDIYLNNHKRPFRIVWDDDVVESIHYLDPKTHTPTKRIENINITPTKEYPTDTKHIKHFEEQLKHYFPESGALQQRLKSQQHNALENYLPLFFDEQYNLMQHLPDNAFVMYEDSIQTDIHQHIKKIETHYEEHKNGFYPIMRVQDLFFNLSDIFSMFKSFCTIELHQKKHSKSHSYACRIERDPLYNINNTDQRNQFLSEILAYKKPIIIASESNGRLQTIRKLLPKTHTVQTINHWQAYLSQKKTTFSFIQKPLKQAAHLPNVYVIPDHYLFSLYAAEQPEQQKILNQNQKIASLNMIERLNTGDYVVYQKHGIGRFKGLIKIKTHHTEEELICIEYADQDCCYIQTDDVDEITPYQGESEPVLHKMGGKKWENTRKKIQTEAFDHGAQLLKIYAQRAAQKGFIFSLDHQKYTTFIHDFPYEETNDQLQAMGHVISDMTAQKPMERLICGDVGFGKTEIAMRATFIAASNKKQTLVLAPTTLLAAQHYTNFQNRFSGFRIRIAMVSRLQQINVATQQAIENNEVLIVIGTHKLITHTMNFSDVGLLIIDEEQRFGVHQKEFIKAKYPNVDTLLMTATPIPRTLNFAMNGLLDLTIMTTPPKKRLPIQTFVIEWDDFIIKEAIERELHRGGQVFVIEQKIERLSGMVKKINALVPNTNVQHAHGQLPKHELENTIERFYQQQIDILVCTTIVEIGIDVQNANTIIIHNAHRFGLSQLYQIRGRIGRSHHQGYAYLTAPEIGLLKTHAQRRLAALERFNQLGIGFSLASEDLEIRGAGDVLGRSQSGHIQQMGFHLYQKILSNTVQSIAQGKTLENVLNTESQSIVTIHLTQSMLIPESYIFDPHQRLMWYRDINQAHSTDQLQNLKEQLIDLFGSLPDPLENLFLKMHLKIYALTKRIEKITVKENEIQIRLSSETNIKHEQLVHLLQTQSKRYKLMTDNTIVIYETVKNTDASFQLIKKFFTLLTQN